MFCYIYILDLFPYLDFTHNLFLHKLIPWNVNGVGVFFSSSEGELNCMETLLIDKEIGDLYKVIVTYRLEKVY